jgi:hypothetical protein
MVDGGSRSCLSQWPAAPPWGHQEGKGAQSLPFPDQSFELVVTWTVLQHIWPERIDRATAELMRMLSSDATVLLCEATRHPNGTCGHTWDRTVSDYEQLLSPLRLVRHGLIVESASGPSTDGGKYALRALAGGNGEAVWWQSSRSR